MNNKKLIVIGLDGGSWNYIQKWIDENKLPIFKKLQGVGAWGILKSQLPPVTSPNWKCYSTGLNPGQLGVFWWENIDINKREIYIPTAKSFAGKEIFDYLSQAGKRVGVLNMPTTFPPHQINGLMIAGGPDALEDNFTYPAALEKLLKNKFNYRVLPQNISLMKQNANEVIQEIYRLIELRFKVADYFLTEGSFDFFQITVYLINVLQHYHWGDEIVFKAWQIIDNEIGKLMAKYPDYALLFMSDHGTNEIKIKFNICNWLIDQGYLKLKSSSLSTKLGKIGLTKDKVNKVLTKLQLKDFFKRTVPKSLQQMLPDDIGHVQFAGKAEMIDWDKSLAVASGQGPLYLIKKDEKLKEQIIKELESLEYQGQKIVDKVYRKEEIYKGEFLKAAPDLIVDQAPNVHFSGSLGSLQTFEAPQHWKGENDKRGLFLFHQPGLKPQRINPTILDLAPTILNYFGLGVPKEMDGKILDL